ncbi:peroxidase-like [Rhopalosiphum maidis]|uniref:peroxidase-like n=1 Tax=Rhopalosiphum maidis TaxID=43146 RepID=UPI000EFF32F6|nr:peroxidase-like [Rhopalosiphum maidis]
MDFSSRHEAQPLLNQNKSNIKSNRKLLKWPFNGILFGLLFLGALYLLYVFIKYEIQPASSYTAKTRNSLHVSSIATTNHDYFKQCAPQVKCDPFAKYRSPNGSCNNLEIPSLGALRTPFFRLLNANFSDGFYKLRLQSNGSELTSPRVINIELFLNREIYKPDENNVLLVPFGQLIAHDISGLFIDIPKNDDGGVIDGCLDENARKTFTQCQMVVNNPPDDPVYSEHNISCMGLFRSMTSRNYSCPLYPSTFINNNTHFIDASEIYGSDEKYSLHLRMMEGGRLNFSINSNGQMFCPYLESKNVDPTVHDIKDIEYDTGDPDNGNQNLGISSMQSLFLRYHNYIAFKLSTLNPYWSDEILYQESRRIVIATIQRITYKDFLPIIIGEDFQEMYGLNEENIYDPTINPSTSQEFSTAAFRILHSLIPVQFNFINKDYKTEFSINVTDWMRESNLLPLQNNFDKLLKGFLETPGRLLQPSYNFYISNFMLARFKEPPYTGRDLLTIDIVRGRDVGLQPYNIVRQFCGLPFANDFEDLVDLIHIKDIATLKELYNSVNDIDLMVGILLEKHSDGAIVGPTSQCLIADGFYRYKAGDRFFYDVQGQPGSFTKNQLKAIQKITFGHVICATTNVDHVQSDIFKLVDHNLYPTSKLKCDDFYLDFEEWEELNDRTEL